ncbi:MAG: hypothetical protein US62_C0025G0012 [Candidatus Woesebacteria bacterium GW2011_GWA1_37_8]|uniref:7 transmembrane helices usually fused to an inactive transglutaminase domain-containing protein n=2 Tax=Candidatus Woeseibacteriota TaxID=1752722 RepID=A0A0G0PCF3_9BACT|nr:MAG: hypothetical protein US39_C0013G0037 [Microgenomates group bacterium GW2011_GWC1_37_12b]KKQ44441.1 MAG: hypothetical protein US62_C0025G0012 [Candidatus Woesebacteria bacterium GW2011_GWA1_37_8]KKQ86966.1 MAG: hypothetical protein UT10_C0013G0015 [Candidatus Woesebacteria bacterium GW2011_GWB1_38_8b]
MKLFRTLLLLGILVFTLYFFSAKNAFAARITASPTPTPTFTITPTPTEVPGNTITKETEEVVEPLKRAINAQELGKLGIGNFLKHSVKQSVNAGVPPNTIVLLLLLPGIATLIAAARHLIGLRGFGIFLPAALSIVFLAIGPVLGISVFIVITAVSTLVRLFLRKVNIKLQYLPRMAMLMFFMAITVLGILFLTPLIKSNIFTNISIFPVLFLILFVEDFIRVQLGKSFKTAATLTFETMVLSLASYSFLIMWPLQRFVLLNPEIWLLGILVIDILVGKYSGLRFLELYRFRKLFNK